jgi:hypothetical protein
VKAQVIDHEDDLYGFTGAVIKATKDGGAILYFHVLQSTIAYDDSKLKYIEDETHETYQIDYRNLRDSLRMWSCINLGCTVELFSDEDGICPSCKFPSEWRLDNLHYQRRNVKW